ncbi:hypothetical protein CBQ28_15190 [Pseudoalteromonas sp. GCY]|uniref:Lipoprotein n=1 Tax=Pseudoalteromonas maricaloris TaxID=184924 RepID=A0A8I2GZT0_9GAMM|nr:MULTISPECIES: hypothetical protein [Pseudoalteromonas]NLR21747.1 hypothetical protein [Pseudoalteromonas maricaloris]ODB39729.1 hypothetical protein BB427_01140 [Pseudoalteromonas sp. BMB]PHI36349.1 hypothetical protein CBQ28_15190 [Pseudoalteromonas sp. GCY]QQQ66888.1 hypothetical protein JJQ94_21995 [Pseudoalteromonas sp. GCY]TMN33637.1 hypothetical protein CWC03_18665 [Pseudoalteromonas sp. S2755]
MKIAGVCVVLLVLLSGCNSTTESAKNNNESTIAKNQDDLYCKQDIITGSKFTKRRCRTKDQIEHDRRAAKDMLNRQQSTVGVQGGQ